MSWPIIKLGNICRIELGKTPSRANKKYWDESKTSDNTWLSIADMPLSTKPVISNSKEYISNEGAKLCKIVPKDTLIVSFKLSLGRLAFTGRNLYTNEAIAALYINDENTVLKDYLYWYLTFFDWDVAAGSDIKVKGKTLNKAKLKEIDIPLPSILEQKYIVTILDQAFVEIEQVRDKTELNLKNSRELFESYLHQIFSTNGDGWIETTLGQEIDLLTGFAFKSKEYVTHSNSIPLIRGDNVVQGALRWAGVKLWPKESISEYEKYLLQENDIVLAMDRTWVKAGMKFSKITATDLPALLVQRVARIRSLNNVDSNYLYHVIGSKQFEDYVLSIQTGLGVPHISGKQIQAFKFSKPNLECQKVIVKTMDYLSIEIEQLTGIYQSKLLALSELKKSILQKAFAGELK
ncbi:restriction endonuclease subunit S [Shewanella sp. SM23]|uniref:restriction endonuclease subunit S n=1 Tax=Shewanella TaxID=22 RepID=UPI0021D9C808|nr:restriction endonuclease subunit S [Shewanella sp. SM23]MCU8083830.1 restriction endonuclease subunit S [Shewanella sp. SM23]